MLLNHTRPKARLDGQGRIITLDHQEHERGGERPAAAEAYDQAARRATNVAERII
jgi:predicted RNA polymerase sigma factor